MLLKPSICIFYLVVRFIFESAWLKPPTIIVELSISPFNIISFFFMYFGTLVMGISIYKCYIILMDWVFYHYNMPFFVSSNNLCLKVLLSDISIAVPTIFWLLFVWYIFFHPFTFKLFVSLNLKCISCTQNIVGLRF